MSGPKYLGTMDEWMRDQEKRITSVERRKRRFPASGGGTTISVTDTATIDMVLTGDSSAGYGLSSNVRAVPVSLLTGPGTIAPALVPAPTAVPVSALTGPGTIAPALLPAVTPTPITVTDTATIDLTLTGAGTAASPWNLRADLIGGAVVPVPVVVTWLPGFRDSTTIGPPVVNKVGTKVVVDRFTVENSATLSLGTNGQVNVATLPVGARPTIQVRFPAATNVAGAFMAAGQILINPDGTVTAQTNQPFTNAAAGAVIWAAGAVSWEAA